MRQGLAAVVTALLAAAVLAADAPTGGGFREVLAKKAADARAAEAPVVKGEDGWYFLANELRAYSVGEFWGENAAKASVATKNQDPLPAIVDFAQQCKKAGVELIVVPVPGKVVLYPEKVDGKVDAEAAKGVDAAHQAFYEALRKEGVTVLDITPEMREMKEKGGATHLKQDTHWSPAAVELTTGKLAEILRKQAWYKDAAKMSMQGLGPMEEMEVTGDLVELLKDAKDHPKEKITVGKVPNAKVDADSPLVVMGDSHVLVYHDNLLGSNAGLVDHLSRQLAIGVDAMGTRGSGANAGRIALARRGAKANGLADKKAIVWVFTAREFTEAFQGWQKVPVFK